MVPAAIHSYVSLIIIYHIIDKIKNFTSTRIYENTRHFTIIIPYPVIIDTIVAIYA